MGCLTFGLFLLFVLVSHSRAQGKNIQLLNESHVAHVAHQCFARKYQARITTSFVARASRGLTPRLSPPRSHGTESRATSSPCRRPRSLPSSKFLRAPTPSGLEHLILAVQGRQGGRWDPRPVFSSPRQHRSGQAPYQATEIILTISTASLC